MKIQTSEELAYWIGVAQTDGSLYYQGKGKKYLYLELEVSRKSLPMLKKFSKITYKIFNLNGKVSKRKDRNTFFRFRKSVTKLAPLLESLDFEFKDAPIPPYWCVSQEFFGAYLAGLIDGDGNIRYLKFKNIKTCIIKISSEQKQMILAKYINKFCNCKTRITFRQEYNMLGGKRIFGRWYELEFNVSPKNFIFFKKFVLPYIAISYKKDKLFNFIKERLNQNRKLHV